MFGLEKSKDGKKDEDFVFDLEKELSSVEELEEFRDGIVEKMESIKKLLRSGEKQELFDKMGRLLYGYVALLKTAGRIDIDT